MRNRKFRLHIPGMVHLPVTRRYIACAFTQKIYKMCQMMMSLGHEVYLYGLEGSDAPCTEFIETHSLDDVRKEWGDGDNRFELGYDWKNGGFRHDINKPPTETRKKFIKNCIDEINKRKKLDDFFLNHQGTYNKPIDDGVGLYLSVEPGIGYRGSYAAYRAFESAYIQNFTYGSEHPRQSINGNFYDRVIPNYFDMRDFEFSKEKDDYFVFLARLIRRKGLVIAHKMCEELGVTLKVAGQGMKSWDGRKLVTQEVTIEGDHLDFVGYVDVEARKPLLAKAKAILLPTLYLEPFGGTNVEAQLSGTPAITTDFGCFPETVEHGKTGMRCMTLNDFVEAGKKAKAGDFDYEYIRDRAVRKYSMDNVKYQFNKWFNDLYDVWESTQDKNTKGWHRIINKE